MYRRCSAGPIASRASTHHSRQTNGGKWGVNVQHRNLLPGIAALIALCEGLLSSEIAFAQVSSANAPATGEAPDEIVVAAASRVGRPGLQPVRVNAICMIVSQSDNVYIRPC
jgi:hypothetical protein